MSEFHRPTPIVDVIVVLWKSAPFMEALFDGLSHVDYPWDKMAVHFVECGPGDGSLDEVLRQQQRLAGRLPPIVIHQPGKNLGFSGGNNLVMRQSIEQGHQYCYLLNHDASFEPRALQEAVNVAEDDQQVGSVQSLMVLQQAPDEVNSRGNAIQFFGFGYCAGYHEKRADVPTAVVPIAFASGAAVLFRNRVLQQVGLFDEMLFMYHEDLDIGWRIMLAGYRNVMVPTSVVRHQYDFSRSISKWYLMERNRSVVLFKNYHWLTLILLSPQLVAIDVFIFLFAILGGWWKEKLRAMAWFWKPSTWSYLLRARNETQKLRAVPDWAVIKRFTPFIAYQEFESPFMTNVANPLLKISFDIIKAVVRW